MNGASVHSLGDFPLADQVPMTFASVRTGPPRLRLARRCAPRFTGQRRSMVAMPVSAEKRDQLFMLAAPFKSKPTALATLGLRFGDVQWGSDNLALSVSGGGRHAAACVAREAGFTESKPRCFSIIRPKTATTIPVRP